MKKKLDKLAVKAMLKAQEWGRNEDGMEIVQVLILLALGVGLVAIFMAFSDQIVSAVTSKVNDFLGKFGG